MAERKRRRSLNNALVKLQIPNATPLGLFVTPTGASESDLFITKQEEARVLSNERLLTLSAVFEVLVSV